MSLSRFGGMCFVGLKFPDSSNATLINGRRLGGAEPENVDPFCVNRDDSDSLEHSTARSHYWCMRCSLTIPALHYRVKSFYWLFSDVDTSPYQKLFYIHVQKKTKNFLFSKRTLMSLQQLTCYSVEIMVYSLLIQFKTRGP